MRLTLTFFSGMDVHTPFITVFLIAGEGSASTERQKKANEKGIRILSTLDDIVQIFRPSPQQDTTLIEGVAESDDIQQVQISSSPVDADVAVDDDDNHETEEIVIDSEDDSNEYDEYDLADIEEFKRMVNDGYCEQCAGHHVRGAYAQPEWRNQGCRSCCPQSVRTVDFLAEEAEEN